MADKKNRQQERKGGSSNMTREGEMSVDPKSGRKPDFKGLGNDMGREDIDAGADISKKTDLNRKSIGRNVSGGKMSETRNPEGSRFDENMSDDEKY